MNWKETAKNLIGGAKQKKGVIIKGGKVTGFCGQATSIPVTPEPDYVCKNCGMLIESCHGHTREECESYDNDPTKPDKRLVRVLKERRVARREPPIKLPNYQSSARSAKK